MPGSQSQSGCLVVFFAVWITGWSVGTLVFDGAMLWGGYKQLAAQSWPTTVGTVTRSKVESRSDSEGTSYRAAVEYRYVVAGSEHQGDTIRRLSISSGWKSAHHLTQQYPPGKQVNVFYNPRTPSESLLRPGLTHADAWMALFLTPFNIIMLGSWAVARRYLFPRQSGLPAGVKIRRNSEGFTLRIYKAAPLTVALATLLAASFLGIFLNAFLQWLLPGWPFIYAIWLLVVCLTAWSYRAQQRRATRLSVNKLRGTFELQRASSIRRITGKLDELAGVRGVHRLLSRPQRDSEDSARDAYGVVLDRQPRGKRRRVHLLVHGWTDAADAERLAHWLGAQLNLEVAHCGNR